MGTSSDEENRDPKTTRVSEKGQTTIPKELREELGVEAGDEVEWYRAEDGLVVRKHLGSGRGALLSDEDEATRRAVLDDLAEQTRTDRESAAWNTGR